MALKLPKFHMNFIENPAKNPAKIKNPAGTGTGFFIQNPAGIPAKPEFRSTPGYNKESFPSPLCVCSDGSPQTSRHLLTTCSKIPHDKREKSKELLAKLHQGPEIEDHLQFLNLSRSKEFIRHVTDIMIQGECFLRTEIVLPKKSEPEEHVP